MADGDVQWLAGAYYLATDRDQREMRAGLKMGRAVLAHAASGAAGEGVHWQALPDTPEAYARALYAALRDADGAGPVRILVEAVPESDGWQAIRDRLARASA